MALQQISLGGASALAAPVDATSMGAQSQTNTGSLSLPTYLQDIANTPFPVVSQGQPGTFGSSAPPTAFTPPATGPTTPPASPGIKIDPFTQPVSDANTFISGLAPNDPATAAVAAGATYQGGNPYTWDPFSFAGTGEGAPLTSETNSQGYKDFGQSWLDLLNTISTQNLKWGGTNDYGGELKGGGTVGPWLNDNIVTPWSSGNQQQAYANAIDFISSQTGKPASDPETQQLGGAFLEYTLQNADRYGLNTQNFDQRKASEGGGKGILGDIEDAGEAIASIIQPELAIAFAALNLVQGGIEGNLTPLSAVGDVLQGIGGIGGIDPVDLTNIAASFGDADLVNLLPEVAQGARLGSAGIGLGEGLSSGNTLQSLGSGVSLGSGLYSLAPNEPSGTTGTNAPESGGVVSGLADSLGITPDQLVGYAGGAIGVGSAATPLIEAATAGGSPTLNVSAPLPPPPTPPAAPAQTPNASGQPLTAQASPNPSQQTYQQPGPRQANPQDMLALLAALGVPA